MLQLRLFVVVGAARGLALHATRGRTPTQLRAKIVVLDGYTATAGLYADPADAWAGAMGVEDTLVVYDRTAPADTLERLDGAAVAVSNKVAFDSAAFAALPDLRLVSITATGTNNVDLAAAKAAGVAVCNVPAYSTASVSQYVAACLLDDAVRLGAQRAAAKSAWPAAPDFCCFPEPTSELAGKTLVLIGRGATGAGVAAIAAALGMRVIFARLAGRAGDLDLGDALGIADYVSLHVPLAPETADLVDGAFLRRMRPGAVLINAARGGCVDEAALADALDAGGVAAAYLDVLKREPPPRDCRLLAHPRAFVTPHSAWSTREARGRLVAAAAADVRAFLAGDAPANRVV